MSRTPANSEGDFGDLFGIHGQADTVSRSRKRQRKKGRAEKLPPNSKKVTRLLSVDAVARRYGVSPATVWRWVGKNDDFPEPIKFSPGTSRWSEKLLFDFERRAALRHSRKKPGLAKSAKGHPTKGAGS